MLSDPHLILAFAYGLTSELTGPSIARNIAGKLEVDGDADKDWSYHINLWVQLVGQ